MLFIYNTAIKAYYFLVLISASFNKKAKMWINGRKQQKVVKISKSIWFHFASLGEFEQGRPVLEDVKANYPDSKIVITFFSPSGYEIRKNTPLADAVYYLPLDTKKNAVDFIGAISPQFAVFTKYEYWYHVFSTLKSEHIPIYIISGIFRPQQIFFKWYGLLNRRILKMVSHFFVQDDASKQLLASIGINNVSVSGDTRFDRVWVNAQHPRVIKEVDEFKGRNKVFIAGSTWPPDEEILAAEVQRYQDWKFIFAPHEIDQVKIEKLLALLPAAQTIRFSQIAQSANPISSYRILVIDNIGMLSSLYQYAEIGYIGGGFGVGIHNTLEAAAFGMPVIFGPNYQRFKEARDLVDLGAGFSIKNAAELTATLSRLVGNDHYKMAGQIAAKYTGDNTGATKTIVQFIKTNNQR